MRWTLGVTGGVGPCPYESSISAPQRLSQLSGSLALVLRVSSSPTAAANHMSTPFTLRQADRSAHTRRASTNYSWSCRAQAGSLVPMAFGTASALTAVRSCQREKFTPRAAKRVCSLSWCSPASSRRLAFKTHPTLRSSVTPNPSLHPTACSGLCPLPSAGEPKRWAT